MSTRDDLKNRIGQAHALSQRNGRMFQPGYIADVLLVDGWRPPMREVATVEELEALPNNEERAIPQEAVEAANEVLASYGPVCNFPNSPTYLESVDKLDEGDAAEYAIAAAEPHLRKKWEQPIWEFARKLARPFPDGVPDREGEAIAAELIDVLKGAGE